MVAPFVPAETSRRDKNREGYNHVAKSAKTVASYQSLGKVNPTTGSQETCMMTNDKPVREKI